MPQDPYDYATRQGVCPVSWEDFHGICRALALAVAGFQPDIILPVGRGGYYPGTLLAHMLQAEIYPIRISRRVNDIVTHCSPVWILEPPAAVAGCRVLIVDEICDSSETLVLVREKVVALRASAVRSAVLYSHTWGSGIPDYIGLVTDALIMNPWDREIVADGRLVFHPEYVDALAQQGLAAGPHLLVPTTKITLAKG